MSNQLVIPFKRTSQPPIDDAVRDYLSKYHPEIIPDVFSWDISHWLSLRAEISNSLVHSSVVDTFLKYHAQLVLMLTKLPVDIELPISYHNSFQPSQSPLVLPNLAYERVCVLFNLASLFCQLAEAENRSTADGIRRASACYQNAAGTFTYLLEKAMPPLLSSLTHPLTAGDLAKPVIKTLEYLMLAQAAECYWQKAVMDKLRNGTIARLSMQVATFYGHAYSTIQAAPTSLPVLPSMWMAHFQTKQHHFEAAAQIRKSMDDSENGRYGIELARLASARVFAKQGQDTARRGVPDIVLEDISTLALWIEEQTVKVQRDNDYIYHQEVPPISALEIIEPANLVNSAVLGGLKEPQTALGGEDALFGSLTSWGARMAIEIYGDRKDAAVANIKQLQQDLDRLATGKLQELNLPAALEMLDRPVELPVALLQHASEVRAEDGPNRIRRLIGDVESLCNQDRGLLNEAYDMLDLEVEEDESARKRFGVRWTREPSHVANAELISKARHFSGVLEQALATDRTVKDKWREWKPTIEMLASDPEILRKMSPPPTNSNSPASNSPLSTQTRSHARILRGHLESLEELRRKRQHTLIRVQNLASTDDISDRIKLEALGLERWTQVKAEMFEDVMGEELDKYEAYREEIASSREAQEELLQKIEERNVSLLQSRREDPVTKRREALIANLNNAYIKYNEIIKNLTEGLKFYNDFAIHLQELQDSCKDWTYARRQDINALAEHLDLLALETPQHQSPVTPVVDEFPPPPTLSPPGSSPETGTSSPPPSPSTGRSSTKREKSTPRTTHSGMLADIPHPNSSQWEPLIPTAPSSSSSPVVRTAPGMPTKAKRQSRDGSAPTTTHPPPQAPALPANANANANAAAKNSKPKRQIY